MRRWVTEKKMMEDRKWLGVSEKMSGQDQRQGGDEKTSKNSIKALSFWISFHISPNFREYERGSWGAYLQLNSPFAARYIEGL